MKKTPIPAQKFIQLTPEYLYEKGKKSYQDALLEEENSKQQEKFINTLLYFQGAMLLGSEEACSYLSEFYSHPTHLGISDKNMSNLIKIIGTISKFHEYWQLRDSICLNNYSIINNCELKDLAIIEKGYMSIIQHDYHKAPISEGSILSQLKLIIKEFNSYLSDECKLITDKNMLEYKKATSIEEIKDFNEEQEINNAMNEFTKLDKHKPTTLEPLEEYREYIKKNDDYDLTGAINCTIS